jgi:murein DD-endopeptidase MepM/ murein hydrolase activator NlpD
MIRAALGLSAGLALGAAVAAWITAGQATGPALEIVQPGEFIGRTASFVATAETPRAQFLTLAAHIEQEGAVYPLFSLDDPGSAAVEQETGDRLRLSRNIDRESHPDLAEGPARIVLTATRPVLFGLRESAAETAVDVTVRLTPPRLAPLSTLHYVTHGGAELVVYRVTPPDAESGVRVGGREYPGYPASGAGIEGRDDLRVAFFALLHDQDLGTRIQLYARDGAGNEATADFAHRIFERQFRRSRIPVGDAFLQRVVPGIVAESPELAGERADSSTPPSELLQLYLLINGQLRETNRGAIAALAGETAPRQLWSGPFRQLANSQVESGFADHRTYLYDGNEIDQQVHLGFDLASTANAPVRAANAGTVVLAEYLGIFGRCVVIDHGMGLQSLYAHLSSIDVSPGMSVERDQQLGLSGQTGLAGGDHLHFAMLLQGRPVTPMEWWDEHWIEDRILRKLREAANPAPAG